MVVLTAISWTCKKWLHKEDYSFDEQMKPWESKRKGKDVLLEYPSEHAFLGFKDRHLEEEYEEYLAHVSKERIIVGYSVVIFFAVFIQILTAIPFEYMAYKSVWMGHEWDTNVWIYYSVTFLVVLAGLVSRLAFLLQFDLLSHLILTHYQSSCCFTPFQHLYLQIKTLWKAKRDIHYRGDLLSLHHRHWNFFCEDMVRL